MKKLNFILTIIVPIAFIFFTHPHVDAAYVLKTKGKKLLIKLDAVDLIKANELYYVVDYNGKKKAIISIKKTQGNKALAVVKKGKAKAGWTLLKRPSRKKKTVEQTAEASPAPVEEAHSTPPPEPSPLPPAPEKAQTLPIGFTWSYNINSLEVNGTKLEDSSFLNVEMNYRMPLTKDISFRALFGFQKFTAEATEECDSLACGELDILYSYIGGMATLNLRPSPHTIFWIGSGAKVLFPINKTVTSNQEDFVDEDSIELTSHLLLGAGFEWKIHPQMSLPLSVFYQIGPKSSSVTSPTALSIQTGVVYHF